MSKIIGIIFLFTYGICNHSQAQSIDSLMQMADQKGIAGEQILKMLLPILDKQVTQNPRVVIDAFPKAYTIATSIKDTSSMLHLLDMTGRSYGVKGRQDSATVYLFRGIRLVQNTTFTAEKALIYNSLGRLHRKDNFEQAIEYYNKALHYYTQQNNQEGIATVLNESGVAYEYGNRLSEALERYQASLQIQIKRKDSVGMGYALEFMSGVYLKLKKYSESESTLFKALDIRLQLKDTYALAANYTNLGHLYAALNKPKQANVYLLKSNAIASSFLNLRLENYNQLSILAEQQQEWQQAVYYTRKYQKIKDSLYNIDKEKLIAEINTQYQTDQQKIIIQEQKFDISKRNYLIAICMILLLCLIILGISWYKRIQLKQKSREKEIILQQQEEATKVVMAAEEAERERIARDLHDGVGQIMSAVKMNLSAFANNTNLLNEEDQHTLERITNLVDESCKEIRTVSHNMMPNAIIKNSLAAAVRNFIDKLDKKTLQVHLYTQGLDQHIDAKIESVFYRIIQESVNNVIKHAQATRLDISVIKDVEGIHATIEDNGIGFNSKSLANYNGIGLKNMQARVAFLNGSIEFDAQIGKGTLVAIYIPIL
jgi:two-component system NarL family sensor kinase